MDAGAVAEVALKMSAIVWALMKQHGVITNPDWIKYIEAGLLISNRAMEIIRDIQTGNRDYDNMSAEQIRELLMPPDWEELELEARRQLKNRHA